MMINEEKEMTKTKMMYIVFGDNGGGECASMFGIYPTEAQAIERVDAMTAAFAEGEDGCEYMSYRKVRLDLDSGTDLSFYLVYSFYLV